jgi:hypothetical protein
MAPRLESISLLADLQLRPSTGIVNADWALVLKNPLRGAGLIDGLQRR